MSFTPASVGEEAGLTVYYDTKTHIKFGRVRTQSGTEIRISENRGSGYNILAEIPETLEGSVPGDPQSLQLEVRTNGLVRTFRFSYDGNTWTELYTISDAWYLSDEGYTGGRQKRFTGCMVGMYACNGGTGTTTAADFDWFNYKPE
jgi:xylan 1,4-beta-xylosidase